MGRTFWMGRVEGGFGRLMEDTQQTCRVRVHLKLRFKAVEMDGITREREQREGEDAGLSTEPICLKVRKQVKQSQRGQGGGGEVSREVPEARADPLFPPHAPLTHRDPIAAVNQQRKGVWASS